MVTKRVRVTEHALKYCKWWKPAKKEGEPKRNRTGECRLIRDLNCPE